MSHAEFHYKTTGRSAIDSKLRTDRQKCCSRESLVYFRHKEGKVKDALWGYCAGVMQFEELQSLWIEGGRGVERGVEGGYQSC